MRLSKPLVCSSARTAGSAFSVTGLRPCRLTSASSQPLRVLAGVAGLRPLPLGAPCCVCTLSGPWFAPTLLVAVLLRPPVTCGRVVCLSSASSQHFWCVGGIIGWGVGRSLFLLVLSQRTAHDKVHYRPCWCAIPASVVSAHSSIEIACVGLTFLKCARRQVEVSISQDPQSGTTGALHTFRTTRETLRGRGQRQSFGTRSVMGSLVSVGFRFAIALRSCCSLRLASAFSVAAALPAATASAAAACSLPCALPAYCA
jgi:hypothetical protein